MTENKISEPIIVTVLASGSVLPFNDYENRAYYRGEVVELTAEQVEGTRDRLGKTIADTIRSEEVQLARWGILRFREGSDTSDIGYIGDDDSTVTFRKRELAEERAKNLPSRAERVAGLKAVTDAYGQKDTGQRTIATYPAPRD